LETKVEKRSKASPDLFRKGKTKLRVKAADLLAGAEN